MLTWRQLTYIIRKYMITKSNYTRILTFYIRPVYLRDLCQLQSFNVNSDVERDLLFHLSRFDEALTITTETLAPNLLCEYVIDIARRANMFYETSRILGSKEEESRLQICYAILQIMECTMHLLGIKVVKRL